MADITVENNSIGSEPDTLEESSQSDKPGNKPYLLPRLSVWTDKALASPKRDLIRR